MKILVPISKVPDTTAKIAFTDNNTKFSSDNVTFTLNPTDEWYALVRAIELVEKSGGSVTVIHVGLAETEQYIRKALAIGANDAIRVDVDPTDAFQVASEIATYAASQGFDLIITGKETIDYNGAQVGGMIAELMDLPYVTLASKLEVENGVASLARDIESGKELIEVNLPLVVAAQKGMAEQRIPNMKGIMASRTKPLQVVPPTATPLTKIPAFELPPQKTACKLISPDNVEELIELLHNEAKVI